MAGLYDRDESQIYFRVFEVELTTIEHVTGQPSTEYVSEETPMKAYGNLHIALEKMRVRSLFTLMGSSLTPGEPLSNARPSESPRVLVIGPANSGKTTLCKILTNYCVRAGQDWTPVLVNVDPNDVYSSSSSLLRLTNNKSLATREDGQCQVHSLLHQYMIRFTRILLQHHLDLLQRQHPCR